MFKALSALALVLVTAAAASAQDPSTALRASPSTTLRASPSTSLGTSLARMEQVIQSHVGSGSFMGTVLVARDGKVVLDKGYGMANIEWDVPNAPNTKFRLGSITKQ